MLAPVFDKIGQPLRIDSVADPTPADNEIVVKIHRCGICGSDLHLTETPGFGRSGMILGHEFSGEVVAIGRGVTRSSVGDRIAALPIHGCGRCAPCLLGRPGECAALTLISGGYGQFVAVDEQVAVLLPRTYSLADGALIEPLAVALHGLSMEPIRPGGSVLILGGGPIGLAALFWAKRLGAGRVDVVEGVSTRADLALAMNADSVEAPRATDRDATLDAHPTRLYDYVVECVGVPGVLNQAISRAVRGGTVISLGVCFIADSVYPLAASLKEIRLLFPALYTRREFEHCLNVMERGAVEPRMMVTGTIGYELLPERFETLRTSRADCKLMIDPWLQRSQ